MDLFDARRVLFVHAHPDDETIVTGALIAALVESGAEVSVLTATRGERGEARPVIAADADLPSLRAKEWEDAAQALGVTGFEFLGAGPARVRDLTDRRYTDSGMRWTDETQKVAGPAADVSPDALSGAHPDEIAGDIATYARAVRADALVTYDETGGYGHPDHVALHAPTCAAAERLGLAAFEVLPDAAGAQPGEAAGATWYDLAAHLDTVRRALGRYASQVEVDGDDIVHVGGQRMPIPVRIGVRRLR